MHQLNLIDQIIDISIDRILCEKQVPADSTVFRGHFPDWPVVPGAFLMESMAQAGGYLIMNRIKLERMALMVAVSHVHFHRFVRPVQRMEIEAHLRLLQHSTARVQSEVRVDGSRCASGQILYRLVSFPTPATKELIASLLGRS
jgi:3-hydroxyacyl-[acyl-carrier-protein] dehydratase